MKHLTLIFVLVLLVSCGGGTNSGSRSACDGACGVLKVAVTGSKSFNPSIEHGRIISYRVTISGAGIETPIVAEFDGTATGGVIENIPVGADRQIVVEAVNANNAIIRQGEQGGVIIEGGNTAEVDVAMQAVPIFTNLADGNTLDNTRLVFQIFSDPANPVAVEDVTGTSSAILADASSTATQINLDVATGLGKMAPSLQPTGQRKYKVYDVVSGRFSEVTLNLNDGTKRRGAPLFATGDASKPDSKRRVSCGTH